MWEIVCKAHEEQKCSFVSFHDLSKRMEKTPFIFCQAEGFPLKVITYVRKSTVCEGMVEILEISTRIAYQLPTYFLVNR